MKKILFFFAVLVALTLSSCGKGEEMHLETDYPATQNEIQGRWRLEKNAIYFTFTFKGNGYTLTRYSPAEGFGQVGYDPHHVEYNEVGTFQMNGNELQLSPLEGEAVCSTLRAYWKDADRTVLNLVPMGEFFPMP